MHAVRTTDVGRPRAGKSLASCPARSGCETVVFSTDRSINLREIQKEVRDERRDGGGLRVRAERRLRARARVLRRGARFERSSVWQRGDEPPAGAEFETANMTIAVIGTEALEMEFSPNMVPVALQVDDVAAARAELESRGVTFHGETIDSGVCHIANFSDREGNALMLHHRYAPFSRPAPRRSG
jgi:predicted enzyme related to lactoylglutathione lyase